VRTIYLDHMHWIQLSRVYHGRSTDPTLGRPRLRNGGRARPGRPGFRCPWRTTSRLPSGVTLEVARLAEVQRELSGGFRFAPPERVVAHELDVALRFEFGGRVLDRRSIHAGRTWPGPADRVPGAFRLVGPGLASIPRERITAFENEANRETRVARDSRQRYPKIRTRSGHADFATSSSSGRSNRAPRSGSAASRAKSCA